MSQTKTQLVEGLNINTSAPADALAIDNSGLVGLGTSTPGSYNSDANDLVVASTGNMGLTVASTDSGNCNIFFADGTTGSQAYRGAVVYQHSTDTMKLWTASSTRMTIDSSGRVGIGSTSFSGNSGTRLVLHDATSPRLRLTNSTTGETSSDGGEISLDSSNLIIENRENANTLFYINGTERMRITSDGFSKFTNNGTYRSTSFNEHEFSQHTSANWTLRLNNHHSSDPYGLLVEYTNAAPNDSSHGFFYARDSANLKAHITSAGGLQNYQANNSNLCDEREKKNIADLDSTWDCLKNWELKKFHYNEDADTDDKRYGVIAQQVAQHCPEVITDWVKQRAEDAVLDEDGNEVEPAREEIVRMGVKEQQMYWMAIKALQEAQTRIETLETANASQAATIAALDARLTALEGA